MAQRGSKRKQAPAYSADTLALRFMAGLALIALGAVIFMAVDLRMPGNILKACARFASGCAAAWEWCLRYCRCGPEGWLFGLPSAVRL